MIEKTQIKKILRSIIRHKDGLPDHQIMHPFREWLLCLGMTMALLTVMVFFCVRLYQHYANLVPNQSDPVETKPTSVIYRSEEVSLGLKNFTTRKDNHTQIKQKLTETSVFIQPVLAIPTDEVTATSSSSTVAIPPIEVSPEATSETPAIEEPLEVSDEPLPVTEAI